MKTYYFNRVIFVLFISLLFVWGCSSNQPDINTEGTMGADGEQSEIDQLFGITDDTENQNQNPEEDEVLQLLGIQKEQREQPTATETAGGEDDLKNEITDLEQKLSNKDSEISNLKSEIAIKDDKIAQLETQEYSKPATSERGSFTATGDFRQDYRSALAEYNNRNYKVAIQMFDDLLARDASNSLSDNCRYWIGECYYGLSDYNQAIMEFTKVFSFTNANKADAAQLKLGLCYWRLGDRDRARQEFDRVISDYPDSEFVTKAQEFIAKL